MVATKRAHHQRPDARYLHQALTDDTLLRLARDGLLSRDRRLPRLLIEPD
jgi:hypothetical protein